MTIPMSKVARRLRVTGLVQGVGFRPFTHRLALRFDIGGWVLNATGAVEIHAEGPVSSLDAFEASLRSEAPVLARIESLTSSEAEPEGCSGFAVRASTETGDGQLPVSPDVALCAACARELADPSNRRYRYPFITCTDCGPRFTVIERMPYDRERTSMRAFTQCPECRREYDTPGDRRYHSETNSCSACGPQLWFEMGAEGTWRALGDAAVRAAGQLLRDGGVLAVRGLGGFHLAVDATNPAAVETLRHRKGREAKPLAVMIARVSDAHAFASVSDAEATLLSSDAAPIVLVRKQYDAATQRHCALAPNVAPGLAQVGVMLAYTPLHHLLLEELQCPLVMTSGNLSDEPIAIDNTEARERLGAIADGFLLHDREIVARYDDSVLRVVDDAPMFLRRSRGYAPTPLAVPIASPRPLLAVGPHLKNTFTLLDGNRAFVSQHIGDLEDLESTDHYNAALGRFESLFRLTPQVAVHDLHPGYLSTELARESGLELLPPVQHHHAHIAAVMAEHDRTEPVVGVAFDGTGYGDDGHTWGAEILYTDLTTYRRVGHLRYASLPGGDIAARSPWRVALGYLALVPAARAAFGMAFRAVPSQALRIADQQIVRQINSPYASSMGRLFDAAAAVIGVRHESQYEGQAAMELEALAGSSAGEVLPYDIVRDEWGCDLLDPLPLLIALGERANAGRPWQVLAASFHETIVRATAELVLRAAEATTCHTVALGGGCFQNARLLSSLARRLRDSGLTVMVPRLLSPNDGAVSFGQAAVAAARLALASQ